MYFLKKKKEFVLLFTIIYENVIYVKCNRFVKRWKIVQRIKIGRIAKNLRLNFKRGEHGMIIRGKVIKISRAFNIHKGERYVVSNLKYKPSDICLSAFRLIQLFRIFSTRFHGRIELISEFQE